MANWLHFEATNGSEVFAFRMLEGSCVRNSKIAFRSIVLPRAYELANKKGIKGRLTVERVLPTQTGSLF